MVHYTAYDGVDVRCSCTLYEMLGILLQHALHVLKKKKVMELSKHYILSRWTLSVKYMVCRLLSKCYVFMSCNLISSCFRHSGTALVVQVLALLTDERNSKWTTHLDLWNLRGKLSKVYEDKE